MRRSFYAWLIIISATLSLMACGNKPIQLELPSDNPTPAETSPSTDN